MLCGTPKCERCGKESVITIRHKLYDAQLCADCYNDANDNKELFLTGVELAPVIHAHWIEDHGDLVCSNCGARYSDEIVFMSRDKDVYDLPHCPTCSAKMDEEVSNVSSYAQNEN